MTFIIKTGAILASPLLLQQTTCRSPGEAAHNHIPSSSSEDHAHSARSHLPVLTEHPLPTLRYWFHVKPTQNHRIGIMAVRTSSCSSHAQEWANRCSSVNALRARYDDENPHPHAWLSIESPP